MSKSASKNLGIELLRGLLSISVVVYHYYYYGPSVGLVDADPVSHEFAFLRFAVSAFFIISGYVIAFSAESGNWVKFSISRISRLFPAILVCATLTLLIADKSLIVWLKTVTMLPMVTERAFIDGSYWSIRFELIFYFIVAVCLLISVRRYLLLVITAMSAIGILFSYLGINTPVNPIFMFPHASLFAIGIAIYELRNPRLFVIGLLLINVAFSSHGLYSSFARVDMFDGVRSHPVTGLGIALVAVALFWISERVELPRFLEKPAIILGAISYPLYLLHQEAGYVIIRVLSNWLSIEVARIVTLGAALLIAYLVYQLVERRSVPALRSYLHLFADRIGLQMRARKRF